MRLRYTGQQPAVFSCPGVALVEPGAVFHVPDVDAEVLLRHPHVEAAPDDMTAGAEEPARRRPPKARTTPPPDDASTPTSQGA